MPDSSLLSSAGYGLVGPLSSGLLGLVSTTLSGFQIVGLFELQRIHPFSHFFLISSILVLFNGHISAVILSTLLFRTDLDSLSTLPLQAGSQCCEPLFARPQCLSYTQLGNAFFSSNNLLHEFWLLASRQH